ncbi:MAG: DNA repair protein RecN [Bacillota bacterium]|nr:DNA repair protein RecN [Bacillota bacterium]
MIEQLVVKDYILFEKAQIDFNNGMSVITGETGAGKSLLIDAIGYLSGDRLHSNIVRQGKEKCVLTMVISTENENVLNFLQENDFEIEDGQIIISRTITQNQKSTIRINQQITTLGFVKQLVGMMVDVHSQMDTYQLMDEKVQLNLLDQYANTMSLRKDVEKAYSEYRRCFMNLKEAKEETYSDDELDYATLQYNKIEELDVKEGEFESLQEQIKIYENAQNTLDSLNASIYALDKESGILDTIYDLYRNLSKDVVLAPFSSSLENQYHELMDICEELKEKRSSFDQNINLDALQEREHAIRTMFRKHGGSYESLMRAKDAYLEKIDKILHRQDVIDKLEKELKNKETTYHSLAIKLSKKRQSVFKELSKKIEEHCHDLMLEKARFKVARLEKEASKDGIDLINFEVSMNPGQPFSPLKLSASGGELSRLMLALKVVFQSQNGIETIIFDEIDTGVSGKVAFAMGNKMHNLAQKYQVLCITHLASVACWANTHYCVKKEASKTSTKTAIHELDEQQTIEELAVMSHGDVSESGVLAAQELKKRVKAQ